MQEEWDLPKVTSASSTSIQGGFPSITQPLLKLRVLPRSRAAFEDPHRKPKTLSSKTFPSIRLETRPQRNLGNQTLP